MQVMWLSLLGVLIQPIRPVLPKSKRCPALFPLRQYQEKKKKKTHTLKMVVVDQPHPIAVYIKAVLANNTLMQAMWL